MTDDGQRIAEDYAALRHGMGACELERDAVTVSGRDATTYLQGQLSQDVTRLAVGESATSLLLEPDGKLCALVRCTRAAEDAYVLDTDAGSGGPVAGRLLRFRLRTKIDVDASTCRMVALRGPRARLATGRVGESFVIPVTWNGTVGADVLGPDATEHVPDEARRCGHAAWEALRIEAGIPRMGTELDEKTIAAEAHLVERAVSFTKGCYTGQELVARLDARGNRVARRLVGIVSEDDDADPASLAGSELLPAEAAALAAPAEPPEGAAPPQPAEPLEGAAPAAGAPSTARSRPAGRCTSAAWCPGLGAVAGLAYLHRSVDVPGSFVQARGSAARLRTLVLPMVQG